MFRGFGKEALELTPPAKTQRNKPEKPFSLPTVSLLDEAQNKRNNILFASNSNYGSKVKIVDNVTKGENVNIAKKETASPKNDSTALLQNTYLTKIISQVKRSK